MEETNNYVSITPHGHKVLVEWGFETRFKQKPNGKYRCYIPAFDIYFTTDSTDKITQKALALTQFFFDHFLDEGAAYGFKHLVLDLHRKGFRTPMDNIVVKDFVNRKIVKAKFKSAQPVMSPDFYDSQRITNSTHREMAFA